jgi:SAM-dependent methyltransferase
MSIQAYLNPPCRPSNLDSFGNRRLILRSVLEALPEFYGTVLDVGCGHMPYKQLLLSEPSRAVRYIGLDLPDNNYASPELEWDGVSIPLGEESVDCILLTEVLEHCPDAQLVLNEAFRVLKPGGFILITVPFIWPLHCVPYDEFRYTPFALSRFIDRAGFLDSEIKATGGRHAVLGVILGLWVRRRPLTSRVHVVTKWALSLLLWPVIWMLLRIDKRPRELGESTLIVGLSGTARKAGE